MCAVYGALIFFVLMAFSFHIETTVSFLCFVIIVKAFLWTQLQLFLFANKH